MITSVKNQTRTPDEVIFVEDRSPDDTARILETVIEDWATNTSARLRLIRNPKNLGQAASLNRGIEDAQSELVMILNDDDCLLHDSVEVVLRLFERYPKTALIGGHSLHFSGDEELSELPKFVKEFASVEQLELELHPPECVNHYRFYNDLNMTHSGSAFLKAAWRIAGGYQADKRKRIVPFSDRDYQLRINSLFPVAVSPTIPLSCWRNDSSVDTGLNS
jgi:GT2 family glycosyltransferase